MKTHLLFIALISQLFLYAQQNDQLLRESQRYIDNKEFIEAERILKQQLRLTKNEDNELIAQLGDVYGCQQRWKEAAACYKKLTLHYPDIADYHYKYGGVLGMMALNNKWSAIGLIDDIKKAFKQAIRLDASHIPAHRALAELYIQLPGILGGSRKKALQYAEALEKLSIAEGYLAKGYIYEYDHQPEKANRYYTKALEHLDKLKKVSRNQLHYQIGALCSIHNKKLDKGLDHLKKYLRYSTALDASNLHKAYYAIAKIYRHKREKEKAMIWIDKALNAQTDFKEALSEKTLIEAL